MTDYSFCSICLRAESSGIWHSPDSKVSFIISYQADSYTSESVSRVIKSRQSKETTYRPPYIFRILLGQKRQGAKKPVLKYHICSSVRMLHRNPVVYLFNFGRGAIWNVIQCEYKHLSSGPVSSEDWRGSNVRPRHGQTPPVSCWRLAAFAPNHPHPPTLQPVTLETWDPHLLEVSQS